MSLQHIWARTPTARRDELIQHLRVVRHERQVKARPQAAAPIFRPPANVADILGFNPKAR